MSRRSRPTAKPNVTLPTYALSASRTALTLIVSEASEEGSGSAGFAAIERSASEALLDIFTRYMRSLGAAARGAAQHAGRSESNAADMLYALRTAGAGLRPRDLLDLLDDAPEVAFPCNLSAEFPAPRAPLSAAEAEAAAEGEPRPPHVADFLPAFPEKRTYSRTATHNSRAADGPEAKKRRSKHRRQAQDSLMDSLVAEAEGGAAGRGLGNPNVASASSSAAVVPPPPLPLLPPADEVLPAEALRDTTATGTDGGPPMRRGGAAMLASVPDILAPSFPGLLQSSARLETSGNYTSGAAFGARGMTAEAELAAATAAAAVAINSAPEREAEILKLDHKHGLDSISYGGGERRGGGGGGAAADE